MVNSVILIASLIVSCSSPKPRLLHGTVNLQSGIPRYDLKKGVILFVPNPSYDAGVVVRGTVIEHDFSIMNLGPICVDVTRPFRDITPIEPHSTAVFKEKLDTIGFTGPVHKSVQLMTNVRPETNVDYSIIAKVVEYISLTPAPNQQFGLVERGNRERRDFTLESVDNIPFEVVAAQPIDLQGEPLLSELRKEADGCRWVFSLTIPPQRPPGPVTSRWLLLTSHPKQSQVLIAGYGTVRKKA